MLQLEREGLELLDSSAILVPTRSGEMVEIRGRAIGGDVTAADLEAYAEWRRFLERQLTQAPPSVELKPGDLLGLGSAGLALRMLGQRTMLELVRVLPMSVADWVGEHFQGEVLRAGLAFSALFGSFVGPRAAGTAINLLVQETLSRQRVQGGGAALISLLERLALKAGVEIETGATANEIVVQDDQVVGVRVGDSRLDCSMILATCDPARVFLKLLDPFLLGVSQIDSIRALRSRGVLAKVHLLVEGDVQLDSRPGRTVEWAYLGADSIDDLARAMDAAKYDQFSRRPALDLSIPQATSGAGSTVVSLLAYGAPYSLDGDWTTAARGAFLEAVVKQLEAYSSGIGDRIQQAELLTPVDLAEEFSLPGGHLAHLEQALDQFALMRPVSWASRYSTPIKGLYLAGSGSHPGGGITGLPGFLGANAALREVSG